MLRYAQHDKPVLGWPLVKNKVKILDPPKEYPEYGGPYYAVYFTDPDGLKLEGMHFPK